MILTFLADISGGTLVLFIICLLALCFFEAINGFHDTANAVATVIYTKTLKPTTAVIWSGLMNFLGVFFGGLVMAWIFGLFGAKSPGSDIGVATGIVKLMPVNEMIAGAQSETIALVLAVLFSAIIWNLGTWYFGIPCSSSHTLIGSLLGAGFAFSTIHDGAGVNWKKAMDIGQSLLISPLFGFSLAVLLMYLMRRFIKNKVIFKEPEKKKTPPTWIRGMLIFTCTMVSFFHGSNDGQKGVGLALVLLLAFAPMEFGLDKNVQLSDLKNSAQKIEQTLRQNLDGNTNRAVLEGIATEANHLAALLDTVKITDKATMVKVRKELKGLNEAIKGAGDAGIISGDLKSTLKSESGKLSASYEFAPFWIVVLISICLGIGTMIGWKRIVVTIGEKIGKSHLTYAQGASAELCAAATIAVSTGLQLPVSTTHVLSSGVAGTMVASGGTKNLQKKTITNIALAWLLTLPVTFVLAALLYFFLRVVF